MIAAWLLFALVALAVWLGCGLAVEAASGWSLPGTIVVSVGLALAIFLASLTTSFQATAPLTTPLVLLVALAGYLLRRRRLGQLRPRGWPLAAALGVYCVCAAPVVLSGSASFLGYITLDDGAVHFSLIHQLLTHGHDLAVLRPSAYRMVLNTYLSSGYPTGYDLPIGTLQPLVGQSVPWLFQPYQALILALGAAALYELFDGIFISQPLRALAAFTAAQSGLLYAFYLEASIKEIVTTLMLTVTVIVVILTLRGPIRLRRAIPLAAVLLAGYDVLGAPIVPWISLPVAVFAIASCMRARRRARGLTRRRQLAAALVVAALIGVIVAIAVRAAHFAHVALAVLTQRGVLGNLMSPLPAWEMLGIWPTGDFRLPVTAHYRVAYALMGLAIASAILGVIWAVRQRKTPLLLFAGGNGIAAVALLPIADAYASAKVMAIFSLTVLATVMLGAAALYDVGRRLEAWLLALVITGGVLWTNALGYHNASIAPRRRFNELAAINKRFRGQGPTFYNMFDLYPIYFLRDLAPVDPESFPPPPRTPTAVPIGGEPWDPNDLSLPVIEHYRLLVIGDSALASRPPSNYQLAYDGRFYTVWRRASQPKVLAHVPLAGNLSPASIPRCSLVRALGRQAARKHAQLAYVLRPPPPMLLPTSARHPSAWTPIFGRPYTLAMSNGAGSAQGRVQIKRPGRYLVEVAGDIGQTVTFRVDGRTVGAVSNDLGPPGQITPVGSVTLSPGAHTVTVAQSGSRLDPDDGGILRALGPVLFLRSAPWGSLSEAPPARAGNLCGKWLEWIEIVRPG